MKKLYDIYVRYGILLLIAFFGLDTLTIILTPLTFTLLSIIFSFLYPSFTQEGTTFLIHNASIMLVPGCIATSAFFLLIFLNIAMPLPLNKHLSSLSFSLILLLLINIIRIILFTHLALASVNFFDLGHALVWYFGSTLFVISIWFWTVRRYHIQAIPFYTDVRTILKEAQCN